MQMTWKNGQDGGVDKTLDFPKTAKKCVKAVNGKVNLICGTGVGKANKSCAPIFIKIYALCYSNLRFLE